MSGQGNLICSSEAFTFTEGIEDPVTRNLVKMTLVRLVIRTSLQKSLAPQTDLDMLYLARVLADFFAEHDVIARTLQGERVGAWFDEDGAEWA
jgi:hypothetical protein